MRWFQSILILVGMPLSSFANVGISKTNCPDGKRHYRTAIRHIESGGIGYENGYTTLEAFFAPDPGRWAIMPFWEARGHVFNNGKWAANGGMGIRILGGNRVYGLNSYYDYRDTGRFNSNQIGIGLETLGEIFDFRLNGYLPVGTKTSHPYETAFSNFSGNSLFLAQKIQSAMKGANAEFGFHWGKSKSFDFYAAAGPYYFIGESTPRTWGGKARILGIFKETLAFEVSDSYDRTFHNKFQGQISLSFSFGPKSKVSEERRPCKTANMLTDRMLQSVDRQEIIVIDNTKKKTIAIDPTTGRPYFFVFVDNTSSSEGTYESPYHSFSQAQDNSSPNDIIYVFPGDETTRGMDAGISLKANQKLWGSGINQLLPTSQGTVSIPAQSKTSPTITNTDIDTDGNAVTLAANNSVSGLTITSTLNNAIYGTDPQSLEVKSCTIKSSATYAIEATFSTAASVSIVNNQFLNNVNGISLTLNSSSTVTCSDNTFEGQTSVSSVPLEISANNNILHAQIANNTFKDNTTGSIRCSLNTLAQANLNLLNNTITNNGTGSQSSLGSSLTIILTGTTNACSMVLEDNTFSNNTSNALYVHTAGAFTTLDILAVANTMSHNGGSAFVLASPVDSLMLIVTDNLIENCNDNGIAVINATHTTTTGTITINNNAITEVGNASNGIAINQDFSNLTLTIQNNTVDHCEGTGIISYAPTGIASLNLDISGNTISNCQNMGSNASSGLDIEQYTSLTGSVTNNSLSDNSGTAVVIGSALLTPTACLDFTGNNSSTDYLMSNPVDGLFNLSPCDIESLNVGTINTSGTIHFVQSCSNPIVCSP